MWAHWADGVIEGMSGVCSRTGPAGTTTCVSSYYYMCLHTTMRPHFTTYVYLILRYMFCYRTAPAELSRTRFSRHFCCSMSNPHTAIYASSYYYTCVVILLRVSAYYYVSSYYYVSALSRTAPAALASRELVFCGWMCPHTAIYVSSYYNICVLILLYMCPRTTEVVSRELVVRACVSRDCCSASSIWKVSHERARELWQLQLHT